MLSKLEILEPVFINDAILLHWQYSPRVSWKMFSVFWGKYKSFPLVCLPRLPGAPLLASPLAKSYSSSAEPLLQAALLTPTRTSPGGCGRARALCVGLTYPSSLPYCYYYPLVSPRPTKQGTLKADRGSYSCLKSQCLARREEPL